jgi:hypothetical protein
MCSNGSAKSHRGACGLTPRSGHFKSIVPLVG